jgi:hypothetical protein
MARPEESRAPRVYTPPNYRRALILGLNNAPDEVAARTRSVYQTVLAKSEHVRAGNFISLSVSDLVLLFDLYDGSFFSGLLRRFLREDCAGAIAFRLSDRMTRAAGKTFMRRGGTPTHAWMRERIEFEIAISTFLLFQTFQDPVRTVTVGGVVCRDRLEALQRTFEHELLHLTEFLAWGMSSCAEENFQTLSRRVFAHEGVHHDLVTPREIADKHYNIKLGDRVSFDFDGERLTGQVNRITKRATVLVEDVNGRLFSDGKTYQTFYVPMSILRKDVGQESGPPE